MKDRPGKHDKQYIYGNYLRVRFISYSTERENRYGNNLRAWKIQGNTVHVYTCTCTCTRRCGPDLTIYMYMYMCTNVCNKSQSTNTLISRVYNKERKRVSNTLYDPCNMCSESHVPGIQTLTNESA